MPTIHDIAAHAKRALRNGRPMQAAHFPTGTQLSVWRGQSPNGECMHTLSLSFFDPRTRKPMMLDPARSLSWLELIFGDDRHKAFVANEVQDNIRNGRREVWNFYVYYRDGKAYMPPYSKAMGDAGIVPYITLERQLALAREAIKEARQVT